MGENEAAGARALAAALPHGSAQLLYPACGTYLNLCTACLPAITHATPLAPSEEEEGGRRHVTPFRAHYRVHTS